MQDYAVYLNIPEKSLALENLKLEEIAVLDLNSTLS